MTGWLLAAAALAYGCGAVSAIVLPVRATRHVSLAFAAIASIAAFATGIAALFGGTFDATFETGLPLGPLTLHADSFGGLFLAIVGLVGFAASIYAIDYLRPHGTHGLRGTLAVLNVLLLSLVGIVFAGDGFSFLIAWEVMAALSYLAVLSEHDDREVRNAAYLMIAISEIGTVLIVVAIVMLAYAGGGLGFDALRTGAHMMSIAQRDWVFALCVLGFGAKIGILPLQLWLPEAHPAAPSHISAVLSAVIVKMGVYGLLRFGVDLLGPVDAWLGLATLSLGALTALLGVLYAAVANDCKRLLAYSTIENVGIIVAAIGLGVMMRGSGLPILAAIVLMFALYHVLGHATYKGLLFLGAGAIAEGTGTRDLEAMGGLMRRMPGTAFLCLIGSLSIAALPPFAGFTSEWGFLETLLQSFPLQSTLVKLLLGLATAVIALAAALAVLVFVRFYGTAFLAMPRSAAAENAREAGVSMRVGMAVLAVAALFLGVLPTFVLTALDRVTAPMLGVSVVDRVVPPVFTNYPGEYAPLVSLGGAVFHNLGLPVKGLIVIPAAHFATIGSPSYLTIALLLALGIVWLVMRAIPVRGPERTAPVWAGGIPTFSGRKEYGPLAYANPIRLIFSLFYRSRAIYEPLDLAARGGASRIEYRQEIPEPLWRPLYRPLVRFGDTLTARIRLLQSGSVNAYVFYIFVIVLIALIVRAL